MISQLGSSPLARGLLGGVDRAAHRLEDHPRSRGVYGRSRWGRLPAHGSSPLARGLQHYYYCSGERHGIIPARAGFTNTAGSIMKWVTDHPRSRGVYVGPARAQAASGGSSPLARGLPGPCRSSASRTRIIPARAGFTAKSKRWGAPTKDHPRSRGVYGRGRADRWGMRGSSPLARGLLLPGRILRFTPGIIPARAGFTRTPRRRG